MRVGDEEGTSRGRKDNEEVAFSFHTVATRICS